MHHPNDTVETLETILAHACNAARLIEAETDRLVKNATDLLDALTFRLYYRESSVPPGSTIALGKRSFESFERYVREGNRQMYRHEIEIVKRGLS